MIYNWWSPIWYVIWHVELGETDDDYYHEMETGDTVLFELYTNPEVDWLDDWTFDVVHEAITGEFLEYREPTATEHDELALEKSTYTPVSPDGRQFIYTQKLNNVYPHLFEHPHRLFFIVPSRLPMLYMWLTQPTFCKLTVKVIVIRLNERIQEIKDFLVEHFWED